MTRPFKIAILTGLLLMAGAVLVVASGGPGTRASAAANLPDYPDSELPPVWGTDIRVNPIITPAPLRSVQRNFDMVRHPTNGQMVVTSWDHQQDDGILSAYGVSTNGGQSWATGTFPGPWGPQLSPGGDTNVAFDTQGVTYYTSAAFGQTLAGYFILSSTNGLNWSTAVPIVVADYGQFRSKSDLAIDTTQSSPFRDRLYVTWSLNTSAPPFFQGVKALFSSDRGQTWSSERSVSDPANNYAYGPTLATAPNGTIYAAYLHVQDNSFLNGPFRLYLDRSTDGGQTWGPDRLIGGGTITHIGRPDFKGGRERVLVAGPKCSIMRIFHFPSIGVSPSDSNTVYAVWNDGRWDQQFFLCGDTGRYSDIAFSRSTDGGLTWSTPIRINDDTQGSGKDQFQPTLVVRSDGLIGVTWLDRRYDPNNYHYDLVYAQSTDGGLTWSQNQRVSDVSNDPNPVVDYKGVDDLGYQYPLVFGPDYVLPGWIKTLNGTFNADYHVDKGMLSGCIPAPDYSFTSSLGASIVPGTSQVPGSTCDACAVLINLPFAYSLYGQSFTQASVSNKGVLQFIGTAPTTDNQCLPTPSLNYSILPFWDNLNTNINDTMGVYTRVMGTAPNRTFIIEWRAGYVLNDVTTNFEIVLYEGQEKFDLVYGQVLGQANGIFATIGVQKGTGESWTQYSCNQSSVQTGRKITFERLCAVR